MVESLSPPTEEPRVADAVARLLARQADLLAQAQDDEAAAGAARLGLSWLADLLRSFDLAGASEWFLALRARADAVEDHVTASWARVGAPRCATLAAEVRRTGSLAPLTGDAVDWIARVDEVIEFAEPEPAPVAEELREPAPPPAPEIEPPPPPPPPTREPEPAPEPIQEPDPAAEPMNEPAPPAEVPPPQADAHAAVFEAIADFAGPDEPAIEARHGRIEIAAVRALPEGEMDGATGVLLRALDDAARAAGAVLLVDVEAGAMRWRVRLPKPAGRHYLFVELAGASLAVPWSRVVEYGLASGSERPRVVLGSGLERVELPIDWLFGKGEGRPAGASSDRDFPAPAGFVAGSWVADADGRLARVLDLALGAEVALDLEPALPEAPEAVQPEPVPADNGHEPQPRVARVTRALVADDSMMARVFLGRLLAQRGIVVEEAEDGAHAQAALLKGGFDLVFLDAEMPGAGAVEILASGGAELSARACVLVKDDEERRRAESFGAVPILYKPFAEDEVRSAVDALLARVPRSD